MTVGPRFPSHTWSSIEVHVTFHTNASQSAFIDYSREQTQKIDKRKNNRWWCRERTDPIPFRLEFPKLIELQKTFDLLLGFFNDFQTAENSPKKWVSLVAPLNVQKFLVAVFSRLIFQLICRSFIEEFIGILWAINCALPLFVTQHRSTMSLGWKFIFQTSKHIVALNWRKFMMQFGDDCCVRRVELAK